MSEIKIKVEVEKKLQFPKLYDVEQTFCVGNGELDCTDISCENCFFDSRNFKAFLEQQKGD